MPWVRLDEEFPDHPKVVTAGPLASWLHVCALAYCNRYLTDGFIPRAQVARLTRFDGMLIGYEGDDGDARTAHEPTALEMAQALVDVGMWEVVEGGWCIHDFFDYQPSKADVEKQRRAKSAAGKKGAASRWGTNGEAVTASADDDEYTAAARADLAAKLARGGEVRNPAGYVKTVAADRRARGDSSPPAPDPMEATAAAQAARAARHANACEDCGGSGYVLGDDDGGVVSPCSCRLRLVT